jgi:hypothetical protein
MKLNWRDMSDEEIDAFIFGWNSTKEGTTMPKMEVNGQEFTVPFQYSEDRKGPFRLYVYGDDNYHSGTQCFRKEPLKYPDEEITIREAMLRASAAQVKGHEVRITDGGDMLVYHHKGGKLLYPKPPADFWKEIQDA